jgi:hypothetical protein
MGAVVVQLFKSPTLGYSAHVFTRALVLVLVGVGCCSCHGFSRYRECRQLAGAVNPVLEEITELDSADENAPLPDNYTAIAERYRSMEKALESLEATLSADFKQGVTTYRGHVRTMARESERYRDTLVSRARAAETHDSQAVGNADNTLRQARERMVKTERAYASAVSRLAALCAVQG